MTHPPVRKSLGQHFLHQQSVLAAIVRGFNPQADEVVVEIGPGRGALTALIAPRVAALHVVEIDRMLAEQLSDRVDDIPNLVVHHEDALRFDYGALGESIRVIGNLPYNISTPLMFRLLDQSHCIRDLHLMLQKEVVDRILAAPGNKTYGRLSVMVQQRCRGELLLKVASGAFTPPPRVGSAMVVLMPDHPPPYPVEDERWFSELVKKAFAQRRKTLHNALKGLVDDRALTACGIEPGSRAERVTVAQFAQLSNQTAPA